jgi:hypothetical protein
MATKATALKEVPKVTTVLNLTNLGENIAYAIEGQKLTIHVDLSVSRVSDTGRAIQIAKTDNYEYIGEGDDQMFITLYIGKKLARSERKSREEK